MAVSKKELFRKKLLKICLFLKKLEKESLTRPLSTEDFLVVLRTEITGTASSKDIAGDLELPMDTVMQAAYYLSNHIGLVNIEQGKTQEDWIISITDKGRAAVNEAVSYLEE